MLPTTVDSSYGDHTLVRVTLKLHDSSFALIELVSIMTDPEGLKDKKDDVIILQT